MFFYEVAPTKVVREGVDVFTYHSPEALAIGLIVMTPVGKTSLTGVVMRAVSKPAYQTRQIGEAIYSRPLPPALLATARWMSEYYATPLATTLQTVLPQGITKKRRARTNTPSSAVRSRTNFLLNKDQASALEQIDEASPGTIILHGITGSGKTAVYISYAQKVLESHRSVILLVPEIALTSQLVAEFSQFFPDIITTHSRQTEAERHLAWESALHSERPRVVIGPRSALFLPLETVGAIIIDEAHEPSLKQDQSPRYSALRVASVLAKQHSAKVIQGSATPLISEYFLAQKSGRPIVSLNRKARSDAIDPTITLVDMTKRVAFARHRFISDTLLDRIQANLDTGQQSLIFHNRRGSASTTLCEACGWSAICPRCIVPFTLHADTHLLRCHICGLSERVPTSCPNCHGTSIIHKGIGTKLIESELHRLFPKAVIARFDADVASEDTVERQYQALYDGAIDIIIGTQVIAKGLDLPHLRTVGVIQADAGLSLPDYTSSERTFQLLAQAVGRVGRSHHSTDVIVQTYQPSAPAIQFGISQDYEAFYNQTLPERQRGKFPPYSYLLKLTCIYKTEATAIKNSKQFATTLRANYPNVTIFGPTPAFYERQRDTHRWQIVVKAPSRSELLKIISELPRTHWQFDIDPMSLL